MLELLIIFVVVAGSIYFMNYAFKNSPSISHLDDVAILTTSLLLILVTGFGVMNKESYSIISISVVVLDTVLLMAWVYYYILGTKIPNPEINFNNNFFLLANNTHYKLIIGDGKAFLKNPEYLILQTTLKKVVNIVPNRDAGVMDMIPVNKIILGEERFYQFSELKPLKATYLGTAYLYGKKHLKFSFQDNSIGFIQVVDGLVALNLLY